MTLWSTLAALGMAFGAPLIYADQAWSIQKRRNAEGFSKDVCAVLLIANISRIFFWFGEKYEFALLLQSILMIVSQIYLLSLLLKFRPGSFASSAYSVASGDRGGSTSTTGRPNNASNSAPTSAQSRTEFSADDSFDGDANQSGNKSSSFPTSIGGLFDTSSANGRYAPLFGLNMPAAPTLDEDEDEEDVGTSNTQSGQKLQRVGRKAVKFLQSGFKRTEGATRKDGSSGGRIFGFWTWPDLSSYLLFLAALIVFLAVLQVILGRLSSYVWVLGMFALGLEATLPVPQAMTNYSRKSLGGFRLSVLMGWAFGDAFKTVYFLMQGSPIQSIISALFALSVDVVICAQLYLYREQTAKDWEDMRLEEAEALEVERQQQAPIEDAQPISNQRSKSNSQSQPTRPKPTAGNKRNASQSNNVAEEASMFQIEADDEDEDDGDMGRSRR
ncbi:uncharacterized protein FA14DRAFT_162340 [Meira miltonrushii]|uniref:PQ-loop-domain-containing protein n=1 Tax=Meira miltonrushii TaxID=1280837 RepID=A0A316V3P4_9BASI|nr:uncharacterized protein FA14DRAFT_162340 [Meira miltonrushii]PWN32072.1 hypothetical protein FA14DRAFT_162340 [Meira miltonrushii]